MNATDLWQALDAIKARYPLQLTLALVHFLWQGCAIAIVFAVTARLLRQAPASTRYVAGVIALLLMAACLPVTLLILPSPPTAAVDAAARPGAVPTPETTSPTAGETAVILVRPDAAPAAMPASPGILSQTPTPAGDASGSEPIRQPAANRVTSILTWASPYTSGLYLCGVAVMLLHVALGLWGGRRLRDACIPATDKAILTRVRDHAHRLGMRVVPLVAYCRRISVPVVVGLLRPMILMPASLASGLTMRQIEAVLLHELAHIRRFDPAVNVLQRLIEAMLFFHPAVWWVSRRISAERESACDDLVLRSNYGRTEYADALVHVGELCTARSDRGACDRAALAATGEKRSQFKRRVLRLLEQNDKPAIRLTTTGVVISILLILSVLLAPAAWRSVSRAEDQPKAAAASEPGSSPGEATPHPASQPAKPENFKPVSMSAEEFLRLSLVDQRALLVRVFRRRMEHAKNLLYEADEKLQTYENLNGEPGRLRGEDAGNYRHFRYWRLGDSYRLDTEFHYSYSFNGATFVDRESIAVNGEEGVGRVSSLSSDKKRPPHGQVIYPHDPGIQFTRYLRWLSRVYDPPRQGAEEYLFPNLIACVNEFEIQTVPGGDLVQLSRSHSLRLPRAAMAKEVYVLNPRRGFLPIRFETRWDAPASGNIPRQWQSGRFVVEESRLVGDVWMPVRLREEQAFSAMPDRMTAFETTVSRIEHGTATPADIKVEFTEGTQIVDTIEGVSYTADAQGKPAGPVKVAPGWKHKPPEWWSKRYRAAEWKPAQSSTAPRASAGVTGANAFSMASRLSPADLEMLALEEKKKQDRWAPIDATLKVLQSKPPASQDQRIEAALQILRIYRIGEKEAAWASAIRELILIGKPAVPRLIEELDRTEREATLRALGFVLRGIGDPRAVPALVRAIPRTLQPPRSDFGLVIEGDPVLLNFMQQYDRDGEPGSREFSYGRPINEIMSALQMMTGQTLGWMEFRGVSSDGGESQQRIKRQLFLKLAERWADWWSKNWQKYVKDEADAQLDLTRRALEQYSKSIPAAPNRPPRSEFPRGPNVTVGEGVSNQFIQSFDESPSDGFLDLDSGRHPRPPEDLLKRTTGHEPSKQLLAWAEREGVDLVNIKITPPGSDKTLYAFKPLGMKVWRIENNRFANIQKELRESKKLELPKPWQGPLAQIDEKTGRYDEKLPVSFLFITNEGTCGALQIKSPVSREPVPGTPVTLGGGLHYEFIYEGSRKE